MMKNRKPQKRLVLFLAVLIAAFLLAESSMILIHWRNESASVQEYEITCQKNVNTLTDLFGNSLLSSVQNANSIFTESWYEHLRNYVGFYEDEFDAATKKDIIDRIVHVVPAMPYTLDLLIIIPETNIVISKYGWHSPELYSRVFGDVELSIADDLSKTIDIVEKTPYILVMDNNTRKYPGYAVIVLNIEKLKKQFLALTDGNVKYALFVVDDVDIFETGTRDDTLLVYQSDYRYPNLKVIIGFVPADASGGRIVFWLLSAVLLLMFVITGITFYYRIMEPMHTLVLKSGGGRREMLEPFDYINSYIDQLKRVQAQLTTANQDKITEINALSHKAREAMLYGMLSLRSFQLDTANALLIFPWLYKVHDMCLLGLATEKQDVASIQDMNVLDGIDHAVQTPTNMGYFALVWLNNDMTLREKEEYALLLRREWSRRNNALCFLSPVFSGFDQVGDIGYSLNRAMEDGIRIGSALSEDMCAQMAEIVNTGDVKALDDLIASLSVNYDPEDLFCALCSVSEEKPAAAATTWDDVYDKAHELISNEMQQYTAPSEESNKYIEFINANLCNPELSIGMLSDAFGKHRTIISKEIKLCIGQTFTDYVRGKRIQLAMERMNESDVNIMQIANEVGYVSYSTFKRAFKQITGKTPIEYRGGAEDEETTL